MELNEAIAGAYPAPGPRHEGKATVQAAIEAKSNRIRRTRRIRRNTGLTALLLALIAGFIAIAPNAYARFRFKQILGSTPKVETFEGESFDPSHPGVVSHVYYDHGRLLSEGGFGTGWRLGDKRWIYEPDLHRVTVKTDKLDAAAFGQFDLRTLVAHLKISEKKVDVSAGSFEGKPAIEVVDRGNWATDMRTTYYFNPASGFPLCWKTERLTPSGWRIRNLLRLTFNKPLDPALFAPKFPAGTRRVDLDKAESAFRSEVAGTVAQVRWEGRIIAIRKLAVTPRGEIYILYTDGETKAIRQSDQARLNQEWKASRPRYPYGLASQVKTYEHPQWFVTDSAGRHYLSASGFLLPANEAITIHGQLLEGLWLMPDVDSPWTPRTLQVHVGSSVQHGPLYPTSLEPLPDEPLILQLHLDKPNSDEIPTWTELLELGPHTMHDLERQELQTRRSIILSSRGGPKDWIANLEAELRLDREDKAAGRPVYADGQLLLQLYREYKQIGDRATARRYLKKAASADDPTEEVKRALKAEHLQTFP